LGSTKPKEDLLREATNIRELLKIILLMKLLPFSIEKKMILMESTVFTFFILSLFPSVFAIEVPSVDIDSLLKTADDLYKQAKYEEAISYYDRILDVEPDDIEVLGKKGDAMASLGNSEQAVVFYGKVIKINPEHVDFMGRLYLDKLLELEPQNVDALSKKGESLVIYYDRLDEAISYFDRVLEIEPGNVNVLFNKGEALFYYDEYEEAISWYDKALKGDPNHVGSLSSKGYALAKLGNFEQSDFYLNKALEIDPTNAEVLYKKGSSLLNEKNYDDALSNFYQALKIDPNHFQSEIKINIVAKNFTYQDLDGFVDVKVHDSNGYLVANFIVRNIIYLDHKIVNEIIDEWPVIQIVNRDGKNYEVLQVKEDFQVPSRFLYGGAHYYGIYFPDIRSDFNIMRATYWQFQVEKGDTVTLTRTVFRPIQ